MFAAFKGKCTHCGHDHDEDTATPAPAPASAPSLPLWEQARDAVTNGTASALERFVHDNEPAGEHAIKFRQGLADVLASPAPAPVTVSDEMVKRAAFFMRHEKRCNAVFSIDYECSCGMASARAALESARGAGEAGK